MNKHITFLICFLPLLAWGTESSTNDPVLQEIIALRESIQRLEDRLSVIENALDSGDHQALSQAGGAPMGEGLVSRLAEAVQIRTAVVNYPWMESGLWSRISKGMEPGEVVAILGEPTLEDPSLHRRVDYVYTYRGRNPATGSLLTGKVKFYRDEVVEVEAP